MQIWIILNNSGEATRNIKRRKKKLSVAFEVANEKNNKESRSTLT